MQRLEPDDKSLVNNFACKVPQTISTTPEGQAEEAIPAATYQNSCQLNPYITKDEIMRKIIRMLFQPLLTGKMMLELIYMLVGSGVAGRVPFLM